MKLRLALLTVVPLLAGITSFLIVRAVLDSSAPPVTANPPRGPSVQVSPVSGRDGPKFDGKLLGIYLAPTESLAEKGIQVDVSQLCPSGFKFVGDSTYVPPEPGHLPSGAVQPAEYDLLQAVPNPGAAVCEAGGQPYTAWRYYTLPRADGSLGELFITRVTVSPPYRSLDVPADLVGISSIGGRQAIFVKPVSEEPSTSVTIVIFPEDSGYLEIQGVGIAAEEIVKVAQSISLP